jgi:Zn finger protein HypA/HybF involved in hydrogenase expression
MAGPQRRGVKIAMHEAGIAARAVDAALQEAARVGLLGRQPAGLDVVIDPARVSAESMAFHLELALRDRGFEGLDVAITSHVVACAACGTPGSTDAWLLCEACGAPVGGRDGPVVEARIRY